MYRSWSVLEVAEVMDLGISGCTAWWGGCTASGASWGCFWRISGCTSSRGGCIAWWGGCTASIGNIFRCGHGKNLGADQNLKLWTKMMGKENFGLDLVVGKLDLLAKHEIHGSKSTKSHKNQQITKFLVRLLFVGIFELGQKHTKLG